MASDPTKQVSRRRRHHSSLPRVCCFVCAHFTGPRRDTCPPRRSRRRPAGGCIRLPPSTTASRGLTFNRPFLSSSLPPVPTPRPTVRLRQRTEAAHADKSRALLEEAATAQADAHAAREALAASDARERALHAEVIGEHKTRSPHSLLTHTSTPPNALSPCPHALPCRAVSTLQVNALTESVVRQRERAITLKAQTHRVVEANEAQRGRNAQVPPAPPLLSPSHPPTATSHMP